MKDVSALVLGSACNGVVVMSQGRCDELSLMKHTYSTVVGREGLGWFRFYYILQKYLSPAPEVEEKGAIVCRACTHMF